MQYNKDMKPWWFYWLSDKDQSRYLCYTYDLELIYPYCQRLGRVGMIRLKRLAIERMIVFFAHLDIMIFVLDLTV